MWRLLVLFVSAAGLYARTDCAGCHRQEAATQIHTSMGRALETVAESAILRAHARLSFHDGTYSYQIERQGERSVLTVSRGAEVFSEQLTWAFGLGSAGQTYVYEHDGEMYQTRVSFYKELNNLDWTLGAANDKLPGSAVQAAGRLMSHAEKSLCFGCHSTNAADMPGGRFVAGIQCERCHGDGAGHPLTVAMKRLRGLNTEQMSDFCGQCHRTWADVAQSGITGVSTVRFQPYRLTNSKCYDSADARIRCTTCHNPHEELDSVDKNYDARCLACHAGRKPAARACKANRRADCVSCHMQKVEIPGSHKKFTDHMIRIVRANAPFPS